VRCGACPGALALSRDGELLIGGATERSVTVWHADTGQPLGRFRGASARVSRLAVAPAGWLAASAADGGRVRIWHTRTGQTAATVRVRDAPVRRLAFAPDGRTLLVAGAHSLHLVRPRDGEPVATLLERGFAVGDAAFSDDGTAVAAVSVDGLVGVWRTGDHRRARSFSVEEVPMVVRRFLDLGAPVVVGWHDAAVTVWQSRVERPFDRRSPTSGPALGEPRDRTSRAGARRQQRRRRRRSSAGVTVRRRRAVDVQPLGHLEGDPQPQLLVEVGGCVERGDGAQPRPGGMRDDGAAGGVPASSSAQVAAAGRWR
jgi:hypothetical protein